MKNAKISKRISRVPLQKREYSFGQTSDQEGANDWNGGLYAADQGGRRDLVEFFIKKGARNWDRDVRSRSRRT